MPIRASQYMPSFSSMDSAGGSTRGGMDGSGGGAGFATGGMGAGAGWTGACTITSGAGSAFGTGGGSARGDAVVRRSNAARRRSSRSSVRRRRACSSRSASISRRSEGFMRGSLPEPLRFAQPRKAAPLLRLIQSLKQIGPPAFQRLPHALEVVDGHVLFAGFDPLVIAAIHVGEFADFFLRDFALVAQPGDVPGNDDVSWFCLRGHNRILRLASLLVGRIYPAFVSRLCTAVPKMTHVATWPKSRN